MLTEEIINSQECLVGLTDEQKEAIMTSSRNNEDEVIGKKLGEVHRQYDTDVYESTGIERNGDEKTYDYVRRAGSMLKTENEELKGKLSDLEKRNTELEASIAKGGDSALKEKYDAIVNELGATKAQFTELKEKHDKAELEYSNALNDYKIESEIKGALSEIKFKNGINDAVKDALVDRVIADIKSKNPIFENKGGKEVLVYHKEDGTPLNNIDNKLEPFTTKELLIKSFEGMDLLEKRTKTGAGGREEKPQRSLIDASSRVEATTMIEQMLSEKGLARGTSEYQDEFNRLWEENEVAKLPFNK